MARIFFVEAAGLKDAGQLVDTERNIREAIAIHLVGLREAGDPVPEPSTVVEYVEAS
jgi:hypothetical protein